jgi:tetratricopeptide (TPR) repeat protein
MPKKKAAAKVKASPRKTHKNKAVRKSTAKVVEIPRPPSANDLLRSDPNFAQAVQNYEAGMKAMQEHKFDRARTLLEKVAQSPFKELADRVGMHLNTCNQQLSRQSTGGFKSVEEHYDYAVSLMNAGDFEGSRTHLEKILRGHPKADYAQYGIAVLECLTGRIEPALKALIDAIKMNPNNRVQARNDADFERLADDPRFTEILYPEPSEIPEPATVKTSIRRR